MFKATRKQSVHLQFLTASFFLLTIGFFGIAAHYEPDLEIDASYYTRMLVFYVPWFLAGVTLLLFPKKGRPFAAYGLYVSALYPFFAIKKLFSNEALGVIDKLISALGSVLAVVVLCLLATAVLCFMIMAFGVFEGLATYVKYGGRASHFAPKLKSKKEREISPPILPQNNGTSSVLIPFIDADSQKQAAPQAETSPAIASRSARLINYLLDMVGFPLVMIIWLDSWGLSVPWWSWFILLPGYYFIMEACLGFTLGKIVTRTLVVVRFYGCPTFGQIAKRTLCRLVPLEPISGLLTQPPQPWHDKWSRTQVVVLCDSTFDNLNKKNHSQKNIPRKSDSG